MIRRLRKKFIIVTTCSVFAVLFLVIGIINIVNYVNVIKNADYVIEILIDGGGNFGDDKFGNGDTSFGESIGRPIKPLSPETPFETRFFTAVLNADGTVRSVNTDRIAAVDDEQAAKCAACLYGKNKRSGFYGNYRYGTADIDDDKTMYVFVDCTKELTSYKNFLLASVAAGIAAFVAVFVLVFFLSGRVMKPVADSYYKQKRFITDVSHEIKTPLTVIGADTEVLEMQGVENEWTESIKEQVKRLATLTEKLVFLARMDEESQSMLATDFSMSDAVEETVKPFYSVAVTKNLRIECDIQKNVSYCGDETLIRQLISQLLDNALKYSDDNGTITVSLKSAGNKVHLSFSNPAKDLRGDLNVLFERFYRNDRSRNSETGGHGIGLSVVKAIVDAHKGKITARCDDGEAVFSVIL